MYFKTIFYFYLKKNSHAIHNLNYFISIKKIIFESFFVK